MLKTRWHNILIILAALGIVKINFAPLSLAQYLDNIGCARHSQNKFCSALTGTIFDSSIRNHSKPL